jgi:hypothetical protein
MGCGICDKREDFLSNCKACHGTAPVVPSYPIDYLWGKGSRPTVHSPHDASANSYHLELFSRQLVFWAASEEIVPAERTEQLHSDR